MGLFLLCGVHTSLFICMCDNYWALVLENKMLYFLSDLSITVKRHQSQGNALKGEFILGFEFWKDESPSLPYWGAWHQAGRQASMVLE